MTTLKLNNGVEVPIIGLGTGGKFAEDDVTEFSLRTALDIGYRHIDTAAMYGNEHVVGKVVNDYIAKGKLLRDEIFVTTKLPPTAHQPEDVLPCVQEQLKKLGLDYVDLYLIHTPCPVTKVDGYTFDPRRAAEHADIVVDLTETYRAVEEVNKKGLAKAIGVSNFNVDQLKRILAKATVPPTNNQIEVHLHWPQEELVSFCQEHGISVTAYAPLGCPGKKDSAFGWPEKVDVDDPVVIALAEKNKKTPAQILLRYLIQRNIIVVPKSTSEKRLRENFETLNFTLKSEDLAELGKVTYRKRLYTWGSKKTHPEFPFTEQLE